MKRQATIRTVDGSAGAERQITADERHRMIAEAAYFRALSRDFDGGDPLDDWCCAEREVDQRLLSDERLAVRKTTSARRTAAQAAVTAANTPSKVRTNGG